MKHVLTFKLFENISKEEDFDKYSDFGDLVHLVYHNALKHFYDIIASKFGPNYVTSVKLDDRGQYYFTVNSIPFIMEDGELKFYSNKITKNDILEVIVRIVKERNKAITFSSIEQITDFIEDNLPTYTKKLNKPRDIGML
jgi:hypothetical protein